MISAVVRVSALCGTWALVRRKASRFFSVVLKKECLKKRMSFALSEALNAKNLVVIFHRIWQ